jgi:hypothetical protein
MQVQAATVVLAALLLASCAATTPPPRFSAVSPADVDAPEAATRPAAPALAAEAATATPGHEGHAAPASTAPLAADEVFSCPMHPEVQHASPGSCPKCGTPFVRRKATRPQQ